MRTSTAGQLSTTLHHPSQPCQQHKSCLLKTTNAGITNLTISLRMRQSIEERRKDCSLRLLRPDMIHFQLRMALWSIHDTRILPRPLRHRFYHQRLSSICTRLQVLMPRLINFPKHVAQGRNRTRNSDHFNSRLSLCNHSLYSSSGRQPCRQLRPCRSEAVLAMKKVFHKGCN
jgi:hypothetical protein